MDFGQYGRLWRTPEIRRLLLVAMVARLPHSAAGVLLTLHVVSTLGLGFAAAGAVAALLTIGIAAGAPWRGRRVDTVGLRRALVPSVVAEAVVWGVAPHLDYPWLLVAAFTGGLFALPVFSVVRQSLGVMTQGAQRRSAFALDSICTEVTFMVGPAAAALAAQASSVWGLTAVGAAGALAGLALMWFNPPTRSGQPGALAPAEKGAARGSDAELASSLESAEEPAPAEVAAGQADGASGLARLLRRARGRGGWMGVAVGVVMAVAAGAGMVLSGTDVAIVALLRGHGESASLGVVFFFWCLASLVGGIVYGAMRRRVAPIVLLLVMSLLTIPMGFAHDTVTLSLLAILPGLVCAPTLSAASERVAELVPEERRGEAMGWYGSALTAGTAIGSPLTGAMVDALGPWAGFAGIGAAGALTCIAGLAVQAARRGRVAAAS